jgi:hypothetical protein
MLQGSQVQAQGRVESTSGYSIQITLALDPAGDSDWGSLLACLCLII